MDQVASMESPHGAGDEPGHHNPELLNWASHSPLESHYRYRHNDGAIDVRLRARGRADYEACIGDEMVTVRMLDNGTTARLAVNGRRADVGHHVPAEGLIHLDLGGHVVSLRNELAFAGVEDVDDGGGRVVAPMHGVLLELLVAPGERVEKGSRLAVLEAMKMSHVIVAELVGTVTQLHATPGTQIAAGDAILVIEPDAE